MDELSFMTVALALAEKGRGRVAPNPLVGAVVVRDGRIVGRGYHHRYGAAHAEVNALNDAGKRARGATLYCTLQPCNHTGKTPPCTDAIIASGIRRLVFAARDPNPKTRADEGLRRLRAARIKVESGPGEDEARRQNEVYFHNLKHDLPFVVLKLAATLDGKIADFQGNSQWITDEPAREYVHRLRGEHPAILVGSRTVITDNPRLTCRSPGRRNPLRVILDPDLDVPTSARVFKSAGSTLVFCRPGLSPARRKPYLTRKIELQEVGRSRGGLLEWSDILDALHARGIASVMVEGGAKVTASALSAGIVDKLYLFMAPRILGGGISFSEEMEPHRLDHAVELQNWRYVAVGRDLLIEAYL